MFLACLDAVSDRGDRVEKGIACSLHPSQDSLTSGHFCSSSADRKADGRSTAPALVRAHRSAMTASTAAGCSAGGRRARKRRARLSADDEAIVEERAAARISAAAWGETGQAGLACAGTEGLFAALSGQSALVVPRKHQHAPVVPLATGDDNFARTLAAIRPTRSSHGRTGSP